MKMQTYENRAYAMAIYPNKGDNIIYPVLGLVGEAGEVAEKIKKVLRDKGGTYDGATRFEILKELGDVLWYVTAVAHELGYTLEDVAEMNLEKLHDRRDRNKLSGEGDNR